MHRKETGKSNHEASHRYDDIIHLPHHVSTSHPQMDCFKRAAQFAPFAALSGYDAAIAETQRMTDTRIELDEDSKAVLDERLKIILERMADKPEVDIIYFVLDEKKSGGSYHIESGRIKKIDLYERILVMENGISIHLDAIMEINSRLFDLACRS